MLKQLRTISMVLFLGSLSTGITYAAAIPEVGSVHSPQQSGICKGVIKDGTGETVIGASIVVKGTTTGTITGLDGDFTLPDVKTGDVIVISFVGYITQEVKWTGAPINIILKEDSQALDEVVVVGYGTQKKVNLTGAVTMTEGKILEDRPIANLAQGLQGAIPNLNITFDSGNPNATTKFNVRGLTSLNGGTALILVDGVETNDVSLLNPQDIESISVLKDASSAAVYGARAAFGVVLITTKKGKKGQQLRVNYNNNFSWSAPSRLPDGVSSDKWIDAINLAGKNDSGSGYWSEELVTAVHNYHKDPSRPTAFVDETGKFTAKGEWGYAGNTDWFDVFYKDAAFMQQHNASISGGSEKNAYYASVGYKGQDGLLAFGTDTYKRVNMSFNFTSQLTDWLEIGFRTKYNRSESDEPNSHDYMGSSPHYEIYRAFPFIPVYLPDGKNFAAMEGSNFNYNFAGILAEAGRLKNIYDDFWYTGSFNLTPLKGLSIKGDYTGNRFFRTERKHLKTIYQLQPDGGTAAKMPTNKAGLRKYDDTYEALNAWAEYKTTFTDKHSLGVMVGYNQEKKITSNMQGVAANLYLNNYPIIDLASTKQTLDEEATVWAVQGIFFRANYDYMGKYLLEVNGRYDGSSKYASGNRWGFFPSASLGWRVSEEKFFESARDFMDNLKIRGSIGSLGNQVTNSNFDYLGMVAGEDLNYILGGKVGTGIKPSTLAYSKVTWEKVTTANFGLDFSILNNRLSATFDYYLRYTTDMVVSKAYPATMGTDGGKENLASMRTNGWELMLNWNDQIADVAGSPLSYNVGIGVSDSYSTITKYDNPTGFLGDLYVGKRLGEIWGYETDGFIVDEAEASMQANRQKHISSTWIAGDIRYKDLNDDGFVNEGDPTKGATNTLSNHGDKKIIGNQSPRYRFNLSLGASWKGFDIRALFEGTMKRDLWLDSDKNVFWGFNGVWGGAVNDYHIDNSWSPTNTNAYYPVPTWSSRSRQTQTKYLQNASYLRMRDLTLGYTLPKSWLTPLGISQLKIFASAQNLFEITNLYKYVDPDMTGKAKANGDMDTDLKNYPFCRSYSFGINLTF